MKNRRKRTKLYILLSVRGSLFWHRARICKFSVFIFFFIICCRFCSFYSTFGSNFSITLCCYDDHFLFVVDDDNNTMPTVKTHLTLHSSVSSFREVGAFFIVYYIICFIVFFVIFFSVSWELHKLNVKIIM